MGGQAAFAHVDGEFDAVRDADHGAAVLEFRSAAGPEVASDHAAASDAERAEAGAEAEFESGGAAGGGEAGGEALGTGDGGGVARGPEESVGYGAAAVGCEDG